VKGGMVVVAGCAESKEVLQMLISFPALRIGGISVKTGEQQTSAVLGTLSQKTSILRSPKLVCSVTDMA
jgi:hypothetical protein